jgi:uncharacterized membrane protein YcaP (DUF421 family)
MDWWANMFQLTLPVAEKILRPILVYLFLVIGLRIAGKRELAQLNPFDLVVLLTISNTVQNAIIGNDNSVTGGILGAITLLLVNAGVVHLVHRDPRINAWVEGRTEYLIREGVINRMSLKREEISEEELLAAARKNGIQDLDQVKEATLDTNGAISFIVKPSVIVDTNQQEILARLAELSQEMSALKAEVMLLRPKGG